MKLIKILMVILIIFSCEGNKTNKIILKKKIVSNLFTKNLSNKGYYFNNNTLKQPNNFNNIQYLRKYFKDSIKFDDYLELKEGVILDKKDRKIASVYIFSFKTGFKKNNWFNYLKNTNPYVQFSKPKKIMILTNENIIIIEGYRIKWKDLNEIAKETKNIISIYKPLKIKN